MSRFYDASQKSERERRQARAVPQDAAEAAAAPPLAVTPESATVAVPPAQKCRLVNFEIPAESRLVALSEPEGPGAAKFRALAQHLENLRNQRKALKSIQITSASTGEGKTLASANLALTFSLAKSKILLIEGDLQNPTLAATFGVPQVPGLTDWWSGTRPDINQSLFQLQDWPLWILFAGGTHAQPGELLKSPQFASVFAWLCRQFDWIIVDSSPLSVTSCVGPWSNIVDGTLLVVREGVTPVKSLKRGLLSHDNSKVLGVIYNEVPDPGAAVRAINHG